MIILKQSLKIQLPQNSCLSICSIAFLIFITVIFSMIIAQNPIIILNIAELKEGQRDMILKPVGQYLNTSKVTQLIEYPVMPRIKTKFIVNNKSYSGMMINFNLQNQQNLGTFEYQLQANHSYIFVHKSLNLIENQVIQIELVFPNILSTIIDLANNQTIPIQNQEELNIINQANLSQIKFHGNFIVKEIYESTRGKTGQSEIYKEIFIDLLAFKKIIRQTLLDSKQDYAAPLLKLLSKVDLGDLASQATVNFSNRHKLYKNPNFNEIIEYTSQFYQNVMKRVGIFAINISIPIAQQYQTLKYFSMFISTMLKLLLIMIYLFSVFMTYNMVRLAVQQQKYQLSVLKLMGASRLQVILAMLIKTFKSSIIANILAYSSLVVGIQMIKIYAQPLQKLMNFELTIRQLPYGIIIGFIIPISASLLLMNKITNNEIIDFLTSKRSIISDRKIQVYIQGQQFPIYKFIFGTLTLVYGLLLYYFLPYGIINQNIFILALLFFILLFGLLLGLSIITYSLEVFIEEIVAEIIYFWVHLTDKLLILKNLSTHRAQNKLTSIIYSLSISLIIVISVGFHLQVSTANNEFIMMMGGDLDIIGERVDPQIINEITSNISQIRYNTYLTMPLQAYLRTKGIPKVMISDKAKLFFLEMNIYGVSGNYLYSQSEYDRQIVYTQSYPPYSIYTYLDTQNGSNSCIISQYAASKFGILDSNNHQLYINIYYQKQMRRFAVNYSSILRKRKGLSYGNSILSILEIGISLQTYKILAHINSNKDIPIYRSKIIVKDKKDVTYVAQTIRDRLKGYKSHQIETVWDRQQTDQKFQNMKLLIDIIMVALLILILLLCHFSLVTNNFINIQNQQKEIGILLMLGYEKQRIFRLYKMETFLLILNASFKGILCGYIVSLLMAWQRELFSSVVVELTFNPYFLLIILLSAFVSSQISSTKALERITNKNINENLRSI